MPTVFDSNASLEVFEVWINFIDWVDGICCSGRREDYLRISAMLLAEQSLGLRCMSIFIRAGKFDDMILIFVSAAKVILHLFFLCTFMCCLTISVGLLILSLIDE